MKRNVSQRSTEAVFRRVCVVSHVVLNASLLALSAVSVCSQGLEFKNPREQFLFASNIHYVGFVALLMFAATLATQQLARASSKPQPADPVYVKQLGYLLGAFFFVWLIAIGINVPSEISQRDAQFGTRSLLIFPIMYANHSIWGLSLLRAKRRALQ